MGDEIRVKMVLDTSEVRAQAAKAAADVARSMPGGSGSQPGSTSSASEVFQNAARATKWRMDQALRDLRAQELRWERQTQGLRGSPALMTAARQRMGLDPYGGPVPPIIPPPVIPGAPPGTSGGGRGLLYGTGISIGGISLGALSTNPAGVAIQVAVMAIRKALMEVAKAIHEASADYARALMRHSPLSWSVQENSLAKIMGVSADTVRQFGAQMAYLNERTQVAIGSITGNVKALTQMDWEWKSLMLSMRAAFSEFAAALAPAFVELARVVRLFVEMGIAAGYFKEQGMVFKFALDYIAVQVKQTETVLVSLAYAIQYLAIKGKEFLNLDFKNWIKLTNDPNMKGLNDAHAEAIKAIWGGGGGALPNPTASASRLPGSAWEQMGLVIGGSGGASPAVETARNTRMTVEAINRLHQIIAAHPALGDGEGNFRNHL